MIFFTPFITEKSENLFVSQISRAFLYFRLPCVIRSDVLIQESIVVLIMWFIRMQLERWILRNTLILGK
jgi:hypothetical protein